MSVRIWIYGCGEPKRTATCRGDPDEAAENYADGFDQAALPGQTYQGAYDRGTQPHVPLWPDGGVKVPADQGLPRSPDPSGRANNTPEARGNADPVNPANGELYMDRLDLGFPGFGVELAHGRTYRSRIDYSGVLGPAWDFTYNWRLLALPESRRLERGTPYPAVEYESTGLLPVAEAGAAQQSRRRVRRSGLRRLRARAGEPRACGTIDGCVMPGRLGRHAACGTRARGSMSSRSGSTRTSCRTGLQLVKARPSSPSSIGGYGELHYNRVHPDEGSSTAELDLHRLVVFVAHRFTDDIRFYSEIEIEHALVADGEPGEVGIEQAYVDWDIWPSLGVRAGVVLVPMGIINQWHEPPIFNGVERPSIHRSIIPTTWREGGVGIYGKPAAGMSYALYLVGGLDPSQFSSSTGLRGGRQAVAEARVDALALTGRFEWEPQLATVVGAAFYAGTAGGNADFFDADGNELDLTVPVVGGAVDARTGMGALEARVELAGFTIGDTAELLDAVDAEGNPGPDVGSILLGGYAEVGYDLLSLAKKAQQLIAFARFERLDTMFRVDGRGRTDVDDARGISDIGVGLTYRPIPELAFKGDLILRRPDGDAVADSTLIDLGIGFMF